MHQRRIACFLLGGWLVGSLLMLLITNSNSDAADELLRSPGQPAAKIIAKLGGDGARMLLFYMADEASRSYTTGWGLLQLALALPAAAILFLERRTRYYSIGVGLMVLLVLFEWLIITPQLDWLGRTANFVSWKASSSARDQYWNLRGVYLGMEIMKILLGAGVTVMLMVMRTRSRTPRIDFTLEETAEGQPRRIRRSRSSSQHAPSA